MPHAQTLSAPVAVRRRRLGLLDYIALYRQRRQLGRLDAHALRDVGLTADEARRESARAVWDVPATWLR